MTDIRALIRLQAAFSIGNREAYGIYCIARENGFSCEDPNALFDKKIITSAQHKRISGIDIAKAQKILDDCAEKGIRPISIESPEYPERLRNIPLPPLVLYIKGDLPDIDNEPVFCIVGPRKVSEFGKKAAYSLAKRLAGAGFIIVSGGALGSDTYAHEGALRSGGRTIAVLGCGIAYDYLPENRELRQRISENCCLISEHPPYAPTTRYSFPVRNRILAGLSLGTAVVEAGTKSGALITARHTNEQGKEVFVVPGNPTLPQYKGSNALLRDGASPLIDASDVFNVYIPLFHDKIDLERVFEPERKKTKKVKLTLSKEAEIVYNSLDRQKFTVDDLESTGLDIDVLLSAITELEMAHVIKALPGGSYTVCE